MINGDQSFGGFYDSFEHNGMLNTQDLLRMMGKDRFDSDRKIQMLSNQRMRFANLSPRIGSREPLTYADAAFVAEVESAALLLSPLVSHHDPRSLLQAQSRVVYRTRRVLELTGQLKDLGNNVLLMGAGLTYHEALGLSYNVNIKNHELLWALLNFILSNDYDIDLFDSTLRLKLQKRFMSDIQKDHIQQLIQIHKL